jgi:subtilase family serine protease
MNLERLEERQLLSASPAHAGKHQAHELALVSSSHTQPNETLRIDHLHLTQARSRVALAKAEATALKRVRTELARTLLATKRASEEQVRKGGLPLPVADLLPRDIQKVVPNVSGGGPPTTAYTPAQIRHAYGYDQLPSSNQGQGVTIAIVDAGGDPTITSDLATFSATYGLPQMDGVGGDPTFTLAQPQGTPAGNDFTGETALDVEWAHAVDPYANILLVQTQESFLGPSNTGLLPGVAYALAQPGVVVTSLSYGLGYSFGEHGEFNGETAFDSYFNSSSAAVTISTGDFAAYGAWPAYAGNVIAVGGTSLFTLTASGIYGKETAWGYETDQGVFGGGGGTSLYEPVPSYQAQLAATYGFTSRAIPDVSMEADPNSGVAVYDSTGVGGWAQAGGTSLSAPLFAGVIALAQQKRLSFGEPTLNSTKIDTKFYNDLFGPNYHTDWHDVTSGGNGFPAVAGYDLATGIGSPKVKQIVALLAPPPV